MYENEYISIGKAAKLLGVSVPTLRRWERAGKLISCFRTFGNHRRYKLSDIFRISNKENKKVVCYSRVSSYDQKEDLERQNDKLMHFSTQKFNNIESCGRFSEFEYLNTDHVIERAMKLVSSLNKKWKI